MTLPDLFTTIQKSGLIPVPVTRDGNPEDTLNYYDGSMEPFLIAAKAIGATAVFVTAYRLDDDEFFYSPSEDDSDDGLPDLDDEVDLAAFSPTLARYKNRLGEIHSFFLVAKGGADDLCLVHELEWFAEFETERERAEGMAVLALQPKKKR